MALAIARQVPVPPGRDRCSARTVGSRMRPVGQVRPGSAYDCSRSTGLPGRPEPLLQVLAEMAKHLWEILTAKANPHVVPTILELA